MNKRYLTIGVALFFVLLPFLSGGKKDPSEPLKEQTEPLDEAVEAKKKLMSELGRKGGKASAKKRAKKKAPIENDVQP